MKIQIPQTIEVSPRTAIRILYDFFDIDYSDMYIKKSKTGVKGIYYKQDMSTHGSPWYEEILYSEDKKKVKIFEHLTVIEKLILEDELRKEKGEDK